MFDSSSLQHKGERHTFLFNYMSLTTMDSLPVKRLTVVLLLQYRGYQVSEV